MTNKSPRPWTIWGAMAAAEAVDVLISEISFNSAQARPKQFSIEAFHPAVAALKQIGKPASLAAVKAIAALPLDAPQVEDPLRSMGLSPAICCAAGDQRRRGGAGRGRVHADQGRTRGRSGSTGKRFMNRQLDI